MSVPDRYVIDANIAIKLFIPDPLSVSVEALFLTLQNPEALFFVPDLFYIEFANVLWKYVRANQYPAEQTPIALSRLQAFPLNVTSTKTLLADSMKISIAHGISAYDASYVALSQRVYAPLLTLDQKLVNTMQSTNFDVQLFSPSRSTAQES